MLVRRGSQTEHAPALFVRTRPWEGLRVPSRGRDDRPPNGGVGDQKPWALMQRKADDVRTGATPRDGCTRWHLSWKAPTAGHCSAMNEVGAATLITQFRLHFAPTAFLEWEGKGLAWFFFPALPSPNWSSKSDISSLSDSASVMPSLHESVFL